LTAQFKVFHFLELDWLLYFPAEGNRGEYCRYTVLLKRKGKENCEEQNVALGAVLERLELDEHYPHTVGFSKAASDEKPNAELRYMEIRRIHNVNEFWLFLNAVNL
jgi:hypothetical protein